ncbi:MAG TPA: hypothetical protein VGJ63_11850 [Micromonosporaceae bacterium]|jgi:hypothetical protein
MKRSHARKRFLLLVVSFLAYAAAFAGLTVVAIRAFSNPASLAGNTDIPNLLVALVALIVAVTTQRAARGPADVDQLYAAAKKKLVQRSLNDWSKEASDRGLAQPIKVRWSSTLRSSIAAAPDEVAQMPGTVPRRLRFHGDVTTTAGAFRQLPVRQLAVIGGPEAGKTSLAVLLVRDLLREWTLDEPVPILLNLSGWNPDEELTIWIERSLTERYPWLGDETQYGSDVTRTLAESRDGGVLPILDGLDELPMRARSKAIMSLNKAIDDGREIVVTCRTKQYEAAIKAAGVPLARTAVIELEPVSSAQAVAYLPLGQRDGQRRWEPVFEQLKQPRTAMAEALSTPLMVYLARVAYTTEDPRRLTMFTHPAEIENHLLSQYLPALYASRVAERDTRRPPPFRCTAAQARLWLGFLARELQKHQTYDFGWWTLGSAAPAGLSGITCGVLAGVTSALLLPTQFVGLGIGLTIALSVGLAVRRPSGAETGLVRGLAGGLLGAALGSGPALLSLGAGPDNALLGSYFGAAIAVGVAVASTRRVGAALVAGFVGEAVVTFYEHAMTFQDVRSTLEAWTPLFNGIGIGLAVGLAVATADRTVPAFSTQGSRLGLATGLTAGLVVGFSVWAQDPTPTGLVVWIIAVLLAGFAGARFFEGTPTDIREAMSPRSVLVGDRAVFRSSGLAVGLVGFGLGLTFGFATPGLQNGLRAGIAVGCVNLVAGGLALAFNQASWGSFNLARLWLAARGRLPLRLLSFLEDAHTRGVLRQVGAQYQFRHARLRDYLARVADPEPLTSRLPSTRLSGSGPAPGPPSR